MPVVGMVAFGWPAVNVAVFFLLESWLFLTGRMTTELTFDPHFAGYHAPKPAWRMAAQAMWTLVLAAIACAFLVLGFGGIVAVFAFSEEDWRRFTTDGWRQFSFQLSLAALVADVLFESIALKQRLADRSPAERRADDLQTRVMFARVLALASAFAVIGMASAVGLGGPALVTVIAAILVYVEMFPRRAVKILGSSPR